MSDAGTAGTSEDPAGEEQTGQEQTGQEQTGEVDLTIVTLRFDAADDAALLAVLSKYVVLTRMHDGCRNVDLCSSVTVPGRHLLVQKWESPEHQRRHFDSQVMVDMARSCDGLLAAPPAIDLWEATSAHDLR